MTVSQGQSLSYCCPLSSSPCSIYKQGNRGMFLLSCFSLSYVTPLLVSPALVSIKYLLAMTSGHRKQTNKAKEARFTFLLDSLMAHDLCKCVTIFGTLHWMLSYCFPFSVLANNLSALFHSLLCSCSMIRLALFFRFPIGLNIFHGFKLSAIFCCSTYKFSRRLWSFHFPESVVSLTVA